MRLVMASANPDKAREIAEVLAGVDVDVEILPRPADLAEVEETGATLAENARLKAAAVADATGAAAVADDTGLEVDALGGQPGIFSARWAGPGATYADNVAKLLISLHGTAPGQRTARFRTVALVVHPDGSQTMAEGVVDGTISREPAGENGFGYDAVFVPDDGDGRTFAEMAPAEKHALSHRGRALRLLATRLAEVTAT